MPQNMRMSRFLTLGVQAPLHSVLLPARLPACLAAAATTTMRHVSRCRLSCAPAVAEAQAAIHAVGCQLEGLLPDGQLLQQHRVPASTRDKVTPQDSSAASTSSS